MAALTEESLPLRGKYCMLPRTFWGASYGKVIWPDTFKTHLDLVLLEKHVPAVDGASECWSFIWPKNDEEYLIPIFHAKRYFNRKLFAGPMCFIELVLNFCSVRAITLLVICRYPSWAIW